MVSGIGNNGSSSQGLLSSISRGGGSVSSFVAGQGSVSLLQASLNNLNSINEARNEARDRRNNKTGFSRFNSSRALFGDFNTNLFNSLRLSSQLRIQTALQLNNQGSPNERQNLVNRLSRLSIEQLAVLKNAFSNDPEVDVPRRLERSVKAMSDRDRVTFKLAVNEAIDNVTSRIESKSGTSSFSTSA